LSGHHGGRIALAVLSFAAALCVCELALRLAPPRAGAGLRGLHELRPDRPWLYGLRPGARVALDGQGGLVYEVNADGFRDRRYAKRASADHFRILVLGDSLTFGYGVALDETYPKRMEAELAGAAEVLNFGVGGYNPYNEAALFADVGVGYEPDLVLVQFCGNDLGDPTRHFDAQTRLHLRAIPDAAFPDPAQRRERASPALARALGLCRRLRLCALVDDAWMRVRSVEADPRAELAALRAPDALPEGRVRDWLAGLYAELARGAAAIDAGFAVLAFPLRAQVEGELSDRLQGQLVALGAERGWQTLDLLPAFRAARGAGEEPLFLDLWHPSAEGHRVAARAILAELARRGLMPVARRG
jgi:lysophospholipase L1-like esterase